MTARRARKAIASVPGKLILMGEHAAVYGRPVLAATVGLRATVSAELRDDAEVRLELHDLDHRSTSSWGDLRDHARGARERWQEYAQSTCAERFGALASRDPSHLVRVALGEAAAHLGDTDLPGLSVEVRSELPVGSGFGSSAAIAVGVLGATLSALDSPAEEATLDRLALEVERRQHGTPSGADHATVLRGGVLRLTRSGGDLTIAPLHAPAATLERFTILHTGVPAESTGEVVAAVRAQRERDPATFERLLDRMEADVVSFAQRLGDAAPDWRRMAEIVVDYQECLEAIGVVPADVRRAVAGARAAGVAAKISGAGGLSSAGAGSLLVLTPDSDRPLPETLAGYRGYPVPLGVPGLSIEVVA